MAQYGAAAHYEVAGVLAEPRGEARGGAAVTGVAPESVPMAWPGAESRPMTERCPCWRSREGGAGWRAPVAPESVVTVWPSMVWGKDG